MKDAMKELFGAEIVWFKNLTRWEKVKAVVSVLLMNVFFVMVCCDNAPLWWYGISLLVLIVSAVLASSCPWDKLEE
ncbi:MAG: hypothetical protein KBT34_12920 [Prevotella sp.]|nr:hypothetical protein [Candidatus Prevotella equi]